MMKSKNLKSFSVFLSVMLGIFAFDSNNIANAQIDRLILQQEIEKDFDVAQEILQEVSEETRETIETVKFQGHVAEPVSKGLKGAASGGLRGGSRGDKKLKR